MREGHWIGNHTYTHSVPLGLQRDPDTAEHEIARTQALIGDLAHPQRWFRPFGGGGNLDDRLLKPSVVEHLSAGGYSCVLWNAIPRDWDDPDGWVERALAQCRAQPWSLMVLHDLPGGAMRHLETFLDRVGDAGARFRQEFPPDCVPIRSGQDRAAYRTLRINHRRKRCTMKIASFKAGDVASYGIVTDAGIIDAGRRLKDFPTLKSVLAHGALDQLKKLQGERPDHALSAVELLPTVPDPDKIFCIGVNYATHLAESGHPTPPHPMIFTRFANSQVGSGQPMIRPLESERFDYEGEMAVIIGKAGRRISREAALSHVAGYACYNDGSIRDWQRHTSQFAPGKNFMATGGFGPWMVTTDEIPDVSKQTIATRLNGVEVQAAPISDLVFDVPALIAYCSTFTELAPGDVIVTGTTGGVGAYRTPPLWMKEGDVVEVEISGIGTLRNPVKDEVAKAVGQAA